ncbi:MAG: hypothetical protein JWO20_661 [Candidatus Angelobacter sp.]|jgi:hypothetical protein|nr:hypothetical protein [Candidatus Angelobacter sp.]
MQTITATQYAIWVLSPLPLLLTAYIMRRTQQSRSFPAFLVYLVSVAFFSYFSLAVHQLFPSFHFYSYWTGQVVSIALSFLVLYEVFRNVLTAGTLPVSKANFALINAVLLLMAAVVALKMQGADTEKWLYAIFLFSRTVRIVQVGLMLILVVLSISFGFYWSSQAFGIALGFGFYASTELVNNTVRALLGPNGNRIWSWVSVLSYQCAAVIWIVYAAKGRKLPVMELPENKVSLWSEPIERLSK